MSLTSWEVGVAPLDSKIGGGALEPRSCGSPGFSIVQSGIFFSVLWPSGQSPFLSLLARCEKLFILQFYTPSGRIFLFVLL